MKKRIFELLIIIVNLTAVILMILPVGISMTWAAAPGQTVGNTRFLSYFDISVIGASGSIYPITTGVFSGLITLIFIFVCILNKKGETSFYLTVFVFFTSVFSIIFGKITFVSVIVSVLLISSAIFQYIRANIS